MRKQKGLCLYCDDGIDLFIEDVDIHHLYELAVCKNKLQVRLSNRHSNLVLLHRTCHMELHSTVASIVKRQKLLKIFDE